MNVKRYRKKPVAIEAVGNLRGALIPEWEKAERGPEPSRWAVV